MVLLKTQTINHHKKQDVDSRGNEPAKSMPNYICYALYTTMLLSRQEAVGAFSATRHQFHGRKAFALRWVDDRVVKHMPEIVPEDDSPRMTAMERAIDCATGLVECDIDDEEAFINGK
jgi:hypothetical protein